MLSLGDGQSNFLVPLYREMREADPRIEVDVAAYRPQGQGVDFGAEGVFGEDLGQNDALSWREAIRYAPVLLRPSVARRCAVAWLLGRRSIGAFRMASTPLLKGARLRARLRKQAPYDACLVHFCSYGNTALLDFLPEGTRRICCVWGSDILRCSGLLHQFWISRAFRLSDIVVTCSPELREIVLAKYGRGLEKKVRLAKFPPRRETLQLIDSLRSDAAALAKFRAAYAVPEGASIVVVGQNAHRAGNQLRVVESLRLLDERTKGRTVLFFPLTYGPSKEDVARELTARCADLGLHCRCLTRFLDWRDLALLRLSTDVLVYMPASDALSATVTESLYAGARLLAASWLPYGTFRRLGLHFTEVDSFADLPAILAETVDLGPPTDDEVARAHAAVAKGFDPRACAVEWNKILLELVEGSAGCGSRSA